MIALGEFTIDEERLELRRGEEKVSVEPLVFRLIVQLARNCGRMVSKEDLVETTWEGRAISDSSISRAVSLARRALATPSCPNPIRSFYGTGYQLASTVGTESATPAVERGTCGPLPGTDFVGRDREITALTDALADLAASRGSLHLVSGEPGIGKTRFSEEVANAARKRTIAVRIGRCSESAGAPSFWPWLQILRPEAEQGQEPGASDNLARNTGLRERILELASHDSGMKAAARDRFALFDGVLTQLSAQGRRSPILLVIDDLHCADNATLELLTFLAPEVAALPVMIVATYREFEAQRSTACRAALGRLSRHPATHTYALAGLSRSEVGRLLQGSPLSDTLEDELFAKTGGNPLFLKQLAAIAEARATASPNQLSIDDIRTFPVAVQDAIGLHLANLSSFCRETLAIGAVVGRSFALRNLARARADVDATRLLDGMDEAVRAGLVKADSHQQESRYTFSHILVRDYLYAKLSPSVRARMHAAIAQDLIDSASFYGAARAATIAHHLRAALPGTSTDSAISWSRRAADFARSQFAYAEAAWQIEEALRALNDAMDVDNRLRCELLLELSDCQIRAGDRDKARLSCEQAIAVGRSLQVPDLLARAALTLTPGFFSIETALYDEGLIELLEEALAACDPPDYQLRARLLGRLSTALYWSDKTERREALSREALSLTAETDIDDDTRAFALHARHCALWRPENAAERTRLAERAVALTERSGDKESNLLYRTMLITDLAETASIEKLEWEIERFAAISEQLKQPQSLWLTPMFRGMTALMRGQFDRVPELAGEVARIGGRVQSADAESACAGLLLFRQFETGDGDDMLQRVRAHIETHPRILLFRAVPPWVAAELGYEQTARDDLQFFSSEDFRNVPRDMNWLGTLGFLSLAAAELRDSTAAAVLMDLLEPFADRFAVLGHATVTLGAVSSHVGRLAAVCGQWPRARSHFAAGLAMNRAAGASPWVARALFDLGRELLLRGEAQEATACFAEADALAGALGMTHLQRRLAATTGACDSFLPS